MLSEPLVLQVDNRLGGQPHYSFAPSGDYLMQIPDEVRKCVVFIGHHRNKETHFGATAFFVGVPALDGEHIHEYLVTAKHNIVSIKNAGVDGKVHLRFNLRHGGCDSSTVKVNQWLFHPTDRKVDVAVFPLDIDDTRMDHLCFSSESFVTNKLVDVDDGIIGPGDDVFITGLFGYHKGTARNVPIIRVGNIAAMPEEPITSVDKNYSPMEAYLIEARSSGGLSGSPVFVHCGTYRLSRMGPIYLLGLMHGHWDWKNPNLGKIVIDAEYAEAINMGIGIVVPAQKIVEVINQPKLKRMRIKIETKWQKEVSATLDMSIEDDEKQTPFTKPDFEEALKKVSRPKSDEEKT